MFLNKFKENSSKLARNDWRKMFLYIATNVHQPETLPWLLNTTNVDEIFMNKSFIRIYIETESNRKLMDIPHVDTCTFSASTCPFTSMHLYVLAKTISNRVFDIIYRVVTVNLRVVHC